MTNPTDQQPAVCEGEKAQNDGSECEYRFCPRPRDCFHYCNEHHQTICIDGVFPPAPTVARPEECADCVAAKKYAWAVWNEGGEKRGNAMPPPMKCEKHRAPAPVEAQPEISIERRNQLWDQAQASGSPDEYGILIEREYESMQPVPTVQDAERYKAALEKIRDEDDSCGCQHDTPDCCAVVGEPCGYCVASVALAAPAPVEEKHSFVPLASSSWICGAIIGVGVTCGKIASATVHHNVPAPQSTPDELPSDADRAAAKEIDRTNHYVHSCRVKDCSGNINERVGRIAAIIAKHRTSPPTASAVEPAEDAERIIALMDSALLRIIDVATEGAKGNPASDAIERFRWIKERAKAATRETLAKEN
jgi:hypothetical protein